ncbi:MAG: transcriptional repressor LexA [Acidimicrobiales bacterium]
MVLPAHPGPNRRWNVVDPVLSERHRGILDYIDSQTRSRGYPPSVREIGEAVGLTSSSTVHAHLSTLERLGYLRRDPSKPRAMEVRYHPESGAAVDRRPARYVPLVGEVAAGTGLLAAENVEDIHPLPADLTGEGTLFMLRVRGESMIGAGILPGDFAVVRSGADVAKGDVVVAGIPGDEATIKTYSRRGTRVVLLASNPDFEPIDLPANQVTIYGKVVTILRRL